MKTAIVTGASRGLGRGIVEALVEAKLRVIGVARDAARLSQAAKETGAEAMAADVSDENAARAILREARPDLVVLCAGAAPHLAPLQSQTWESFSINWNVDAKAAFGWLREALLIPLAPGSHVIVVSSGAALQGSPLSGSYAGAKRMQWMLTEYAAQEAKRLGLDLRFHCLLPTLNPSTELGRDAIAAYAARAGLGIEEFSQRFQPPLTPAIMGRAVLDLHREPSSYDRLAYTISGKGLSPV